MVFTLDALFVKQLHLFFVAMSYALFLLRGIWMLRGSPRLQQRWVRIVPHYIDTGLLASAVTLATLLGISPLDASWLMAKIFALLLYISLGSLALKHGKTMRVRLIAWLSAQGVFFYIISVAMTHDPMPWRALTGY